MRRLCLIKKPAIGCSPQEVKQRVGNDVMFRTAARFSVDEYLSRFSADDNDYLYRLQYTQWRS